MKSIVGAGSVVAKSIPDGEILRNFEQIKIKAVVSESKLERIINKYFSSLEIIKKLESAQ